MDIRNDYFIEWNTSDTGKPFIFELAAKYNANNEGINNIINTLEKELDIEPKSKEWKSKYNSYVVYDYEPLCIDGFDLIRKYNDTNRARFLQYLINKRLSDINVLETYKDMKGHTDNEHTLYSIIEV